MITTAIGIVAGIFGGIAVLLSQTNHPDLSIAFGILFIVFSLFALFVHRKEVQSKRGPLKIVFIDNAEADISTHIINKPLDWDKFFNNILIANPLFSSRFKNIIKLQGIDSFILTDLVKKNLFSVPQQKNHD